MLDFNKILLDGGLLAALFILMLLALGRANPRYFLSKKNIPPDIFAAVPSRTPEEARKGLLLSLPLLALMLGFPVWSGYTFAASGAGFGWLLAHIYLVLLFPFFGDLLIVDWLVMNTITPKWVVYPGTEGFAGYKDYGFHLRAHIRGLFVIGFLALFLAGGVWLAL